MVRNIIGGLLPYWTTAIQGKKSKNIIFLVIVTSFLQGKCAMSRCFPFPPPGYERKHTPEDLDLLKEAKRKEKKQKREKKDKERKKDKEKKEKDASAEKHREKDRKEKHKDKKEKHRDKKKDKKKDKEDRIKDKEKSSISEESTVAGKVEHITGGKLHPKVPNNDTSSSSYEGKCFALCQGQKGGKPSQGSLPSLVNDESKFVRELDRRIRDEKGTGSQLPERVVARNSSGQLAEEKIDNKNKEIERKFDPQGLRNECSGNTMVQNIMPMEKSEVKGMPKPVHELNGRMLKDLLKYKEAGGVKRGDKQKDRDKESQEKEKDREKRKEETAKIKPEITKSSQNLLKDDGRNDLGIFSGKQSANLSNDTNHIAANEPIIRKRKETLTNGFLHESEIRPNKIPRPAPHPLTENGRKLEPSQTPTKSPHNKPIFPNSIQEDSKHRSINGIIEAQKPSPPKPKDEASKVVHHTKKPLKVPKAEDLIAEASRRPPHPDLEYLMEVLKVPKMEDWPGYDDQEWLFSLKGSSSKHNVGPVGFEEGPLVWSEAVHIESADVCALPYVIPY